MSTDESKSTPTQPSVSHLTIFGELKVLRKLRMRWRDTRTAFIDLGGSVSGAPTFFVVYDNSKGLCYNTATGTILVDHGDDEGIDRACMHPLECTWHPERRQICTEEEQNVFRTNIETWGMMGEAPDHSDSTLHQTLEPKKAASEIRLPQEGDSELDIAKLSIENLTYLRKELGHSANRHPYPSPAKCSVM